MTKKSKKSYPVIYLDENMDPAVVEAFKPQFRTFKISQAKQFKGRDEKDYISELYSENAFFVTSDAEFVNYVAENRPRHAGIIHVPMQMTLDEKVLFCEIAAGFVEGACKSSSFRLRNFIIYPAHDGLRTINNGKDKLEFSWDWLSQMVDAPNRL